MWQKWVCPKHGDFLSEKNDSLVCPKGEHFRIINNIPRFVPKTSYADAFGEQWNRYRLTQLDSYTGTKISRDRVRLSLGDELWSNLKGKYVLEAGCGSGRFTEILLERGAFVTSIDLSSAVEANQKNFPQNVHHRIAQANILSLPFMPKQFDLVFCLGVVQHTPNPKATIKSLAAQVKSEGALVFDHYTYSLSAFTKITEPIMRQWLKRVSPESGIRYTEKLVDTFLPFHRKAKHYYFMQALLSRLSPIRSYYQSYPELNDELQYEWAMLDTHDALTSWYRHKLSRIQIINILRKLNFVEIRCEQLKAFLVASGKQK